MSSEAVTQRLRQVDLLREKKLTLEEAREIVNKQQKKNLDDYAAK